MVSLESLLLFCTICRKAKKKVLIGFERLSVKSQMISNCFSIRVYASLYVEFKSWKHRGTDGWSSSISHCFSTIILVNAGWHWNYEDEHYQTWAKVKCLLRSARLKFTCRLPVPFLCFPILWQLQMTPCPFLSILKLQEKTAENRGSQAPQFNRKIQRAIFEAEGNLGFLVHCWGYQEFPKSLFPKAVKMQFSLLVSTLSVLDLYLFIWECVFL